MPELHITGKGMTDEETDELARVGAALGMFRQCSIGYHEECSDPDGERCTCTCHITRGAVTRPRKEKP